MSEAFTSLLATLAPALGLPEISVREDDPSCLLVIDDFEVSLRLQKAGYIIFSKIKPIQQSIMQKIL